MNQEILPIHGLVPEVKTALALNQVVILQAAPGAGKSTYLPLTLLDETFLNGKKILMLEPRRLAALSVAQRLAEQLGQPVGNSIGYRIRFDHKVSLETKLEVVTEGILTRRLQEDNALEDVGLVIFDEFHERNLQADLAFALCYEIIQVLRPDLRMLIMSATLDLSELQALIPEAPVLISEGRQFPVSISYVPPDANEEITAACARACRMALRQYPGDILVFLPGLAEIRRLYRHLESINEEVSVQMLYGQLSMQEQHAAILPHPLGKRKIVISSAIAETSLTIEGIGIVIDSGLARWNTYDAGKGMNILVTRPVTLDAATQRAGRAGRLMAGHCIRMWPERKVLVEKRKPEILDSDLSPLLLELARFGIADANALKWVTSPPISALNAASTLLKRLNALDEKGHISEKGKAMLQWPVHPRLAYMLLEGGNQLACKLAALLEETDPLRNPGTADIAARLAAITHNASQHPRLQKLIYQFEQLLRHSQVKTSNHNHPGELLAIAFPERIAKKKSGTPATYILENGQEAVLQDADPLCLEEWLVVVNYDTSRKGGNIFLAAVLDIYSLSTLFREEELLQIQEPAGILLSQTDVKLGRHVISSKENQHPNQDLIAQCWIQYLQANEGLGLDWNDEVINWMGRINILRRYNPEENWPAMDRRALLNNAAEWLKLSLMKIKNKEQLSKIRLLEHLKNLLPWELSMRLDELAPTKIMVPTGSQIQLNYAEDGSSVVLAVRLQEVFGWMKSPEINRGRIKILLHLLSPSYRPAQVTSDLLSFWKTGYHEVRKDLRGRYPKHHWPEDPLTAIAMKGPKKRNPETGKRG